MKNGQLLVRVGKESCVFSYLHMDKMQILDALDILWRFISMDHETPYYQTGRMSKFDISITRLDPGPDLDALDLEEEG